MDTNVVIHLRNGDRAVSERVKAPDGAMLRSIVSLVELGVGVYRDQAQATSRRPRLDAILGSTPVLAYDDLAADAYRMIMQAAGYSRRKLLDRMTTSQALVHRSTLVTIVAAEVQDVPGLDLLVWP